MVALVDDCGEELSWNGVAPMPCMIMVWGEPGASSVRVIDAERAPVASGVKETLIEQLAFTGIGASVQLLLSEKSCGFAPPNATFEIWRAAEPILVT